MASRKWRVARRRHYRTRLVDLRTSPTRFARSATAATLHQVARDSQPFHAIALGEAIAEALPELEDVLAGELVE